MIVDNQLVPLASKQQPMISSRLGVSAAASGYQARRFKPQFIVRGKKRFPPRSPPRQPANAGVNVQSLQSRPTLQQGHRIQRNFNRQPSGELQRGVYDPPRPSDRRFDMPNIFTQSGYPYDYDERPVINRPPPKHPGVKVPGVKVPPNAGNIEDIIAPKPIQNYEQNYRPPIENVFNAKPLDKYEAPLKNKPPKYSSPPYRPHQNDHDPHPNSLHSLSYNQDDKKYYNTQLQQYTTNRPYQRPPYSYPTKPPYERPVQVYVTNPPYNPPTTKSYYPPPPIQTSPPPYQPPPKTNPHYPPQSPTLESNQKPTNYDTHKDPYNHQQHNSHYGNEIQTDQKKPYSNTHDYYLTSDPHSEYIAPDSHGNRYPYPSQETQEEPDYPAYTYHDKPAPTRPPPSSYNKLPATSGPINRPTYNYQQPEQSLAYDPYPMPQYPNYGQDDNPPYIIDKVDQVSHHPDGPDYSSGSLVHPPGSDGSAPFKVGLDLYPIEGISPLGAFGKQDIYETPQSPSYSQDDNKHQILLHLNLFSKKPNTLGGSRAEDINMHSFSMHGRKESSLPEATNKNGIHLELPTKADGSKGHPLFGNLNPFDILQHLLKQSLQKKQMDKPTSRSQNIAKEIGTENHDFAVIKDTYTKEKDVKSQATVHDNEAV